MPLQGGGRDGIGGVGGGQQLALGVAQADPAQHRLRALQRLQARGPIRRARAVQLPLGGAGLQGGQQHLHARSQRVGGLAGGLAQARLGVGAHLALGRAGRQLGRHQRADDNQHEHRPADGGGDVAARVEPLRQRLARRAVIRRGRLR
ncbi:hypothetical protein ACFSTJ_07710 [Ottowia pentelensis]|uniref:hypothetical protein n=1 Tax=Ottowia pentelensis TaxID=511108 RepID=UPI00363371CC